MYDDIRLHYGPAVTSQLSLLAPLFDEILDVVTTKEIFPITVIIIEKKTQSTSAHLFCELGVL
jgi:hypothetical protein